MVGLDRVHMKHHVAGIYVAGTISIKSRCAVVAVETCAIVTDHDVVARRGCSGHGHGGGDFTQGCGRRARRGMMDRRHGNSIVIVVDHNGLVHAIVAVRRPRLRHGEVVVLLLEIETE